MLDLIRSEGGENRLVKKEGGGGLGMNERTRLHTHPGVASEANRKRTSHQSRRTDERQVRLLMNNYHHRNSI